MAEAVTRRRLGRGARLAARARSIRPGAIGQAMNSTYWGVLALRQAGQPVSGAVVSFDRARANEIGGFPWIRGVRADTDDTSAAVQALAAAGVHGKPVTRGARIHLRARQTPDGGFELQPGAALERAVDGLGDPGALAARREAARGGVPLSQEAACDGRRQPPLLAALRDDAVVGLRAGAPGAHAKIVSIEVALARPRLPRPVRRHAYHRAVGGDRSDPHDRQRARLG